MDREGPRGVKAASWKGYMCIRWESCSGKRGYVESGEDEVVDREDAPVAYLL